MATPTGLTGAAAISLVRAYINEPTLPVDATILTFLNRAVEQVAQRVNGLFLFASYPTTAAQTTITLNSDVLYVASASFSTGATNTSGVITSSSPTSAGALVYPLVQMEQASFMDYAAGFPSTGSGVPQAFFVYQDQGTNPTSTLPVPNTPVLQTTSGTSAGTLVEVVTTYTNTNASGVAGETTKSAATDLTPTTTQQVVVQSPQGVSNATGYNVYAGASGGPYYLQNGSTPVALGSTYTIPGTLVTGTATPPGSNTATGAGAGGAMLLQLYPSATLGQLNIYYRARPQLWADTTSSSWTNLDSSAQEAVVLFAVMRTLQNRGRGNEVEQWRREYEGVEPGGDGGLIGQMKALLGSQRAVPRSGRVRDVLNLSYPSAPPWVR